MVIAGDAHIRADGGGGDAVRRNDAGGAGNLAEIRGVAGGHGVGVRRGGGHLPPLIVQLARRPGLKGGAGCGGGQRVNLVLEVVVAEIVGGNHHHRRGQRLVAGPDCDHDGSADPLVEVDASTHRGNRFAEGDDQRLGGLGDGIVNRCKEKFLRRPAGGDDHRARVARDRGAVRTHKPVIGVADAGAGRRYPVRHRQRRRRQCVEVVDRHHQAREVVHARSL